MKGSTHRLAWLLVSLAFAGCYRPPSEQVLVQRFESNRSGFDRLLTLTTADSNYRRISGGEIPPRGMGASRYQEYLALFRELGIEGGVTRDLAPPGGVFVIASSDVPIGGKGRSVGYVYSAVPLSPLVKNLDQPSLPIEIHRGSGRYTVYRELQDHWYLYYDSSW